MCTISFLCEGIPSWIANGPSCPSISLVLFNYWLQHIKGNFVLTQSLSNRIGFSLRTFTCLTITSISCTTAYCNAMSKNILLPVISHTMPARSLGKLPVNYAIDELQNPLLHTTILFEGQKNSTGGRSDYFQNS